MVRVGLGLLGFGLGLGLGLGFGLGFDCRMRDVPGRISIWSPKRFCTWSPRTTQRRYICTSHQLSGFSKSFSPFFFEQTLFWQGGAHIVYVVVVCLASVCVFNVLVFITTVFCLQYRPKFRICSSSCTRYLYHCSHALGFRALNFLTHFFNPFLAFVRTGQRRCRCCDPNSGACLEGREPLQITTSMQTRN